MKYFACNIWEATTETWEDIKAGNLFNQWNIPVVITKNECVISSSSVTWKNLIHIFSFNK